MNEQSALCHQVMNCFTGGIILDSADVRDRVTSPGIRHVTAALAVLRKDGRLSFKKSGRSYVYWVELANIEPKPIVFVDSPVIGSEVSYSAWGHLECFINKSSLLQRAVVVIIIPLPWVWLLKIWLG